MSLVVILFWFMTWSTYLVNESYVSIFLQLLWIPALLFPMSVFIYFIVRWGIKKILF